MKIHSARSYAAVVSGREGRLSVGLSQAFPARPDNHREEWYALPRHDPTDYDCHPPITGWEGYFLLVWHAPVGRWITG